MLFKALHMVESPSSKTMNKASFKKVNCAISFLKKGCCGNIQYDGNTIAAKGYQSEDITYTANQVI